MPATGNGGLLSGVPGIQPVLPPVDCGFAQRTCPTVTPTLTPELSDVQAPSLPPPPVFTPSAYTAP